MRPAYVFVTEVSTLHKHLPCENDQTNSSYILTTGTFNLIFKDP